MANRDAVPPTRDDDEGMETHPAWGMIGASRVSATPGSTLFDSDLLHQHYVVVRVQRAERRRNLMRDWLFGGRRERIVEIAMSEAQWASFVSTMNVGEGVPCTLLRVGTEEMPELAPEPRLAESMEEVEASAERVMKVIQEAFAAYREKSTKANLRRLESAIQNAPANMTYAASSLTEHAENVVQRARADIEAMVTSKAEQLGIDPSKIAATPLLEPGDEEGGE
jgi:hypothetical protein